MHMTFWWDYKLENFIFYGYNVNTILGLIATMLFVATLAFFFEYVKLLQAKQRQQELIVRAKQVRQICPMMIESSSLLPRAIYQPLDLSLKYRAKMYANDAAIWFALLNLAYLIMLTVMVYNLWIFLSILFGGTIGHLIFGNKFMKINIENCHVIRDTYCMAKCTKPEIPREGESTPVAEASSSRAHCQTSGTPADHNEISVLYED